ncbi:MAG: hypothetical protein STHCBS139747_005411 [Sporothrix thermara]
MQLPRVAISRSRAAWKAAFSTSDGETKSSQRINKDLAPTPEALVAHLWSNGVSLIAVGLTWWQALISCILANIISSTVWPWPSAVPAPATTLAIQCLPVASLACTATSSLSGIHAVVAIIWFGVQSCFGSQLFSAALHLCLLPKKAKSVASPLACIGVFAWCVHYGGGLSIDSVSATVTNMALPAKVMPDGYSDAGVSSKS